jgi:hypothetical protein
MKGLIEYGQYEGNSIKTAPDGYYVAHVEPDFAKSKVTKQIILTKHNGDIYEPLSSFNYRGHIYRMEGPIQRVGLID